MPTYQYRCTECGNELEIVQKFSDDPLTTCKECSGKLRKVFSPVGVVFKGSGFYATDSRRKQKPGTNGAKSAAGSETSATSEKSASSEKSATSEKSTSTASSTPDSTSASTTTTPSKSGTKSDKKTSTAS